MVYDKLQFVTVSEERFLIKFDDIASLHVYLSGMAR